MLANKLSPAKGSGISLPLNIEEYTILRILPLGMKKKNIKTPTSKRSKM